MTHTDPTTTAAERVNYQQDEARFAVRRHLAERERTFDRIIEPILEHLPDDAPDEEIRNAVSEAMESNDELAQQLNEIVLDKFVDDYFARTGWTPSHVDDDGDVIYRKA